MQYYFEKMNTLNFVSLTIVHMYVSHHAHVLSMRAADINAKIMRTRQIIRYRATAILQRLQIKQYMYTASNEWDYKTNDNII